MPAIGLDGLGSASYGPEAALTILMPLGAASLAWVGWVMAPILALLAVLYLSYRQTIVAYPSNGGAYTVSRENLGRNASLLAAASLMVDYILNVAVGISAGVGALTSSVPALQPWTLPLCLAVLAVVTLANLRGTPEAGWLFALPSYVFVVSFLGLVRGGLWNIAVTAGHPHPVVPPPSMVGATGAMSVWLFMRAFASGCTAMTGVEAVSNAVSAFKEPVVDQAHKTLTVICLVLGILLAGIATVAHFYGLAAMDQTKADYQNVLSQLAAAIAGRGIIYYIAMTSLLAVLCLSANTSFVGFPLLCRIVAQDGYLPRSFAVADRRLVFSVGILVLTFTAGGLLILFGGITDRLIPLFAIGAFLTFSMSQIGMVRHWRREGQRDARRLAPGRKNAQRKVGRHPGQSEGTNSGNGPGRRTGLRGRVRRDGRRAGRGGFRRLVRRRLRDFVHDLRWRRWNERRSLARAPEGESMLEVQGRVVRHIERARAVWPDGALALVSHAEVIRAALIYFLGLSLDAWRLIEISPASITKLVVNDEGATVLGVNEAVG